MTSSFTPLQCLATIMWTDFLYSTVSIRRSSRRLSCSRRWTWVFATQELLPPFGLTDSTDSVSQKVGLHLPTCTAHAHEIVYLSISSLQYEQYEQVLLNIRLALEKHIWIWASPMKRVSI